MKWILAVLACFIIIWSSCGRKDDKRTSSTAEMVEELQVIADQARHSTAYPYFTDHLLKQLEFGIQGLPYTAQHGTWLDYVLVLLLKGSNEKCVEVIDQLQSDNNFTIVTRQSLAFFKVKALAFLRMGEIENCIANHSSRSCIMPLKGAGIHQVKDPVENAIELYEKLLSFDPADEQSRWFLNLCYMATGEYPQEVPRSFLIPPGVFQSEAQFPEFKNIAMDLGVAVNNHAGGTSVEDFNNDGLLDIFTSSYSLGDASNLFINRGATGFENSTDESGLDGLVGGLNHIHADFNNDGWTDIYVMRGAWLARNGQVPNSLLVNDEGNFSDGTKAAGLYTRSPTGSVAAADFNLDGYLDIFVGNESTRGARFPSQLFMNQKDGTFVDIAKKLGLTIDQFVKGAVWGDINLDGLPDLFVSIYGGSNRLYLNEGGDRMEDWKFTDIANNAGVNEPLMSFTTWFWDYDQDGLEDIMVFGYDNDNAHLIAGEVSKDYQGLPFKGETPRLFKNNGDLTFTDVTIETDMDRLLYVMGGNFGDMNSDGFPDMYLGTGEFNIWASIPNRAFLNNQDGKFKDVTTAGAFGQIQKGHGVAFGDLDNDGDQDIYHQVGGAAESDVFFNMLFENPGFGNNWISLKLEGIRANRSAIGARIKLCVSKPNGENRTFYHWVNTGGSFGANTLRAEMGIGQFSQIDSLIVTWPDIYRSKSEFSKVEINKHYSLNQDAGALLDLKLAAFSFESASQMHHHH